MTTSLRDLLEAHVSERRSLARAMAGRLTSRCRRSSGCSTCRLTFEVAAAKRDRSTSYYRRDPAGGLELADAPDGQWSHLPAFPAGGGGLASTDGDWYRFARMLLGARPGLLSRASVQQMTSNHLTQAQRDVGALFLEGQGWGFGGSVDDAAIDPWNVPGRYGWVGGTRTTAHIVPSTGTVAILLTQVALGDPVAPAFMRDFWQYAA